MPKAEGTKRRAPRGLAARKQHAEEINRRLAKTYPDAHCALEHTNPLELLVATILSAQCTDARVNMVTKDLFKRYKAARDYAEADPAELEQLVRTTGFFRNKAKNIQGAGRAMVDRFGGRVPNKMEDLLTLPGVARKTANVVMGNAFHEPTGVVVDTHVQRVTRLLGMTKEEDPVKIEKDLMAVLPKSEWIMFSHRVIFHGRQVCIANRPKCEVCPLEELCPGSKKK